MTSARTPSDTSDRSRPCTGSSMPSITPSPSTGPNAAMTADDENVSLSRSICWTSSWRYTMNIGSDSSCGSAPDVSSRCTGSSRRSRANSVYGSRTSPDIASSKDAEILQVVEKLFHDCLPLRFLLLRRDCPASDAKRCNTGCGRTRAANTIAFWLAVNGHAPSRIEPCLGMPSTIRDMWCMPDAGRILLDTNSIEASGPTPRRRNGSLIGQRLDQAVGEPLRRPCQSSSRSARGCSWCCAAGRTGRRSCGHRWCRRR